MDIDELIEQLKYYGTTYAIGDNLGKEIDGSDELMLNAATALSTLQAENEKLRAELERVKLVRCKDCKMSRPGGLGYVWCGMTAMPPDGFCSNGQQKED